MADADQNFPTGVGLMVYLLLAAVLTLGAIALAQGIGALHPDAGAHKTARLPAAAQPSK